MEVGKIIACDPFTIFFASYSHEPVLCWFRGLVPIGGELPLEDNSETEADTAAWYFASSCHQTNGKKGQLACWLGD